jgi:hypothetical protein
LILSIVFTPGSGKCNISFESLYVGLSRVCFVKDLMILPYESDPRTNEMIRSLQPLNLIADWLGSYTQVTDGVYKMTPFLNCNNKSASNHSTPQTPNQPARVYKKRVVFKDHLSSSSALLTPKKRKSFAVGGVFEFPQRLRTENIPLLLLQFQSYIWTDNNCYLTGLLESLYCAITFLRSSDPDLLSEFESVYPLLAHFQTRFCAERDSLIACTNEGLRLAYLAVNHIGVYSSPLEVCLATLTRRLWSFLTLGIISPSL